MNIKIRKNFDITNQSGYEPGKKHSSLSFNLRTIIHKRKRNNVNNEIKEDKKY